jgi:uncharacterized protein
MAAGPSTARCARIIARYINHSCKPNAESEVRPRDRAVFIRAISEPGEEINYDYGAEYFDAYLKPIGCKCDACEKKRRKKRTEARAQRARLESTGKGPSSGRAAKSRNRTKLNAGSG